MVVIDLVGLFYVLVIGYVFLSRLLSNCVCFRYFFCIVLLDIFMVRVVRDLFYVLRWNFIYVLYFDMDYGWFVIEIFY